MFQVEAAATVEVGDINLLEHSDLNVTRKVNHDAHTGEWALEINATGGAIEQDTNYRQTRRQLTLVLPLKTMADTIISEQG